METYQAMQRAIAGRAVEHAKRLGLKTPTIYKWTEPHTDFEDSGAYNPLDRIHTVCATALHLGIQRSDALAPIYWLNHEFGLVCFDMPDVGKGGAVAEELIRTIKEFSDLTQATSDALGHGRIDKQHRSQIIKEAEEALRAIGALMGLVKELER